jgi:hypothetical protein
MLFELGRAGLLRHFRKRLYDLFFRVVDMPASRQAALAKARQMIRFTGWDLCTSGLSHLESRV